MWYVKPLPIKFKLSKIGNSLKHSCKLHLVFFYKKTVFDIPLETI